MLRDFSERLDCGITLPAFQNHDGTMPCLSKFLVAQRNPTEPHPRKPLQDTNIRDIQHKMYTQVPQAPLASSTSPGAACEKYRITSSY